MSEEVVTEESSKVEEIGPAEGLGPCEPEEYDGSYFPTSFLPVLHDLKKCVELFKDKSVHDRSLFMGAGSLVESLDQAIRWATNIEDIEADIKKKAKK